MQALITSPFLTTAGRIPRTKPRNLTPGETAQELWQGLCVGIPCRTWYFSINDKTSPRPCSTLESVSPPQKNSTKICCLLLLPLMIHPTAGQLPTLCSNESKPMSSEIDKLSELSPESCRPNGAQPAQRRMSVPCPGDVPPPQCPENKGSALQRTTWLHDS